MSHRVSTGHVPTNSRHSNAAAPVEWQWRQIDIEDLIEAKKQAEREARFWRAFAEAALIQIGKGRSFRKGLGGS